MHNLKLRNTRVKREERVEDEARCVMHAWWSRRLGWRGTSWEKERCAAKPCETNQWRSPALATNSLVSSMGNESRGTGWELKGRPGVSEEMRAILQ